MRDPETESSRPLDPPQPGAALEPALRVALLALREYLPQLVLIGGWVPYLYQQYGGLADWTGRLSLTSEADVLIPRALPAEARTPLSDTLRDAGLVPEGSSGAVWVGNPARGESIEFFAEHVGTQRDIGRPTAVGGQAGVAALALRRLSILGRHTTIISVPSTGGPATGHPLRVRVPLLGAYILQKAATFADRLTSASASGRQKATKDLLYIRDVLAAGPTVLARLRVEMAELKHADPDAKALVRSAVQNLALTMDGSLRHLLPDAASMRHEREPSISRETAGAELEGRLRDAMDLLQAPGRRKAGRGRSSNTP